MSRRTGTLADQERGSWVVNFVVKAFFGILLISVFLSLIQCTVKTPASPSWDTNLTIPLIERTYPMSELVNKIDGNYLSVDSSGAVLFEISKTLDTVRLDSTEFQTTNLSQSLSQTLGGVSITPPAINPVVTPVSAIGPLALALPGTVPPMSFQVNADLPAATSYSSMTIGQGSAWLVIENQLGLDLSSVSVQLVDASNSQLIGTFNFAGGIPAATRDSVPVNLAGHTLSNQLSVITDCQTGGGTVLSAANKELIAELRFSNAMTVTSATTTVPALSRSVADSFQLNETHVIQQATLQSGALALSVTNSSNLPATLSITIPDLHQNNAPLSIQQIIAPLSTASQSVNLSGAVLAISDQTAPQQIPVQVVITSVGSGSNQISVNASDQFAVNVSLSNLNFASVSGALDIATTIAPTTVNVDIPQGFENGSLAQAVLQLSITNRFGVAGDYTLQLNANTGKQLTFNGLIAAANGNIAVVSTSTDTNVANFLSPLPSIITLTGTAHFGDGVTIGTVSSGDFVVGDARFTAPLALTLGATQVDFDVERVNTDGVDKASSDIQQAELVYTVNNHLPIGASLALYLGPDSTTLLANPEVVIDSITLLPGQLSGGIVSAATSTGEQRITLSRTDLNAFKHNPLFIQPVLLLPGSGGQVVRFSGSDFITLTARAELTYRFDGSF